MGTFSSPGLLWGQKSPKSQTPGENRDFLEPSTENRKFSHFSDFWKFGAFLTPKIGLSASPVELYAGQATSKNRENRGKFFQIFHFHNFLYSTIE